MNDHWKRERERAGLEYIAHHWRMMTEAERAAYYRRVIWLQRWWRMRDACRQTIRFILKEGNQI
jgi:hypothetical protein